MAKRRERRTAEERREPCPACGGTGQMSYFKGVSRFLLSVEECPECAGLGYITPAEPTPPVVPSEG